MANQKQKPKKKSSKSGLEKQVPKALMGSMVNFGTLGIVLLFFVSLYLVSPPLKLPWSTMKAGDYPKESILAEVDFTVKDIEATRLAGEQAARETPPVYVLDPEIVRSSLTDADAQFEKIGQDVLNPLFTHEERIVLLSKYMPGSISEETLGFLADLDHEQLESLRAVSLETLRHVLNQGVMGDVPGSAKQIAVYDRPKGEFFLLDVGKALTPKNVPAAIAARTAGKFPEKPFQQRTVKELSLQFIRGTLAYDEKLTKDAQNEARESVPDVTKAFKKNQEIVQAGHEITEQDILELNAHENTLLGTAGRLQTYMGNALILAMVFVCFLYYLRRFRPEISKNNKAILLVGILVFLTLATGRLFLMLPIPAVWLYLVPVAAGSILLSILVDDRMALVYSFFIAILYSAQGNYQLSFFLVAVFGSLAGVFYMRTIRSRSDVVWPGIAVAVVNVVTILALYLIGGIHEELLSALLAGMGSGLITAIGVVPGSLIPLEGLLGIVTNIRLLELSDMNHPLLKQLAMQAPGTYHHSLLVGNMAEAAAENIGANSLLARVGSYYHDVGKMNKPLYFSENQGSGKNKHDELAPTMSALVLISHVKEGVELAREHRLNQPIVEFIQQHHGTSLMPYFYQKAMEQNPNHAVEEETFRYLGPKPQSRETAICMLADSVEAASRPLANPTHGRIKGLVEKIVSNKVVDFQLDECNLTMKDLHNIAESFVRVLAGYLHSRVEYPTEQTVTEIKGKFEGTDPKVGTKTGNKARADSKSD